jgi:hypothetical protein
MTVFKKLGPRTDLGWPWLIQAPLLFICDLVDFVRIHQNSKLDSPCWFTFVVSKGYETILVASQEFRKEVSHPLSETKENQGESSSEF